MGHPVRAAKAALGTPAVGIPRRQKLLDGPVDLRARYRPFQSCRGGDELNDLDPRPHRPGLPQSGRPGSIAVDLHDVDGDGRTPEEAHPADRPSELQPSRGECPDAVAPAGPEPRLVAVHDPQPNLRLVSRSEPASTRPIHAADLRTRAGRLGDSTPVWLTSADPLRGIYGPPGGDTRGEP
jgi:hypothetical protein